MKLIITHPVCATTHQLVVFVLHAHARRDTLPGVVEGPPPRQLCPMMYVGARQVDDGQHEQVSRQLEGNASSGWR